MKKFFKIMLATILAIFTIPFGGIAALADGKVYDNIEDGEYEITAKALHADKDEPSGAAGFISEEATLIVNNGEIEFTIVVPHNDMAEITGLQIEEIEPTVDGEQWTYSLSSLKSELDAQVQYEVPALNMKHDVPFRFVLEGLDELPEKENPEPETPEEPGDDDSDKPGDGNGDDEDGDTDGEEPTEAPDERVVDELLTEQEADAVYELNYETDSPSVERQFENPVKLLEQDNKQYIQIPINKDGAQFFRSLKIDGNEVTWNSITEGPYVIQFELSDGIEDEFDLSMVIQAGPNVMPHDGIKLWFDKDSLETIKEPKPEEQPETDLDPDNLSKGVYTLDYTFLKEGENDPSMMDGFKDGPAYVKVDKDGNYFIAMTFNQASMIKGFTIGEQEAKVLQVDEKQKTKIYEFTLDNLTKKHSGAVAVEVPGMYDTTHKVDLVFDTDSLEKVEDSNYPKDKNIQQPTKPGDQVQDPKPEKPKEDPKKTDEEKTVKPDKAYEINYVVKHATKDEPSAADNFFVKPGILLEIDGEKYLQLTINNWDMIDWLKYNGKNVNVIKVNGDGSALVQLKVEGNLTDIIDLSMKVTVPGMYSTEHDARLVLDPDSLEEVPVGDHQIYDSPAKPDLGDNGDNNDDKTANGQDKKTDNPKTGDTSKIVLYALLLMGSLVPLGIQVRRRFV